MIQRINYDFSELIDAMAKVKQNPNVKNLNELKAELNRFYKDSICREIIYTHNTDKMFFGMSVMPYISEVDISQSISTDEKMRIREYYLEFDSKLFDLLTTRELVAVLLHEVGHMVNDSKPMDTITDALNVQLARKNENLPSLSNVELRSLLLFAYINSLQKIYSLFEYRDEEVIADEFSVACGFGDDLEDAIKKIVRNTGKLNKGVTCKLAIIQWSLRIYKDLGLRRLSAIRTLKKIYSMSPSELEKRSIRNVVKVLEEPTKARSLTEGLSLVDRMLDKASSAYRSFKYKGMRGLEDDLYEYSLRIENVETEDDALIILRGVNLRMSMIDDYILEQGKNISDSEKERWFKLKNKYQIIRDKLSAKKIYKDKYYSLFVNTPVVHSRYEA